MTQLPPDFASWPLAKKVEYAQRRLVEYAAAKRDNPIGFYVPLVGARPFHESTARNRLLMGGNRAGKTEGGSAEDTIWLSGESPFREIPKGPLTGVISAISFGKFEETLLPTIRKLIPKVGKWSINFSRSQGGGTIEGPNGVAYIKSAESGWEAYQGMALDFAHFDEEHPLEVYKQVRKRLKAGSFLHFWMTMTAEPDRPDSWAYEELALPAMDPTKSADFAMFKLDLNDNRISRGGYIPDSEIDYLISVTPVDERDAVIKGEFHRRGGLIYPMWDPAVHVERERSMKDFLEAVHEGVYTPYCWLDWGVRNPTAIGLVLEDKDGTCHLIDEIYRPARDVLDIKREFNTRFGAFQPVAVFADPSIWHNHDSTDPERTIAGQLERDDLRERLPGLPLYKASNDEINGIAACRELLKIHPEHGPKFVVQPRCVNFRKEIPRYVGQEWASRPHERNKKEVARQKDNHHCDGFKYFALSPHGYIRPRWQRRQPNIRVSPVTGYVRAGVA